MGIHSGRTAFHLNSFYFLTGGKKGLLTCDAKPKRGKRQKFKGVDTGPKNTKELEAQFMDDESCLKYIFTIRLPNGYEKFYPTFSGYLIWVRQVDTQITFFGDGRI